jgi:hypothetical protein
MTDLMGWIGYFFFLSVVGSSGVVAIITAYLMRGVFRILYVAGTLAIISSLLYLPLSFRYNADFDLSPNIPDAQFLFGTWQDNAYHLELQPDSSYRLSYLGGFLWREDSVHVGGTWRFTENRLSLSDSLGNFSEPWLVTTSAGYYFITYSIPDNLDAWTGNLGLMRASDWDDTH